jgi:K+-sensing histidine kinase KdpD
MHLSDAVCRFLRSRLGTNHLIFLVFCALLAGGAGCGAKLSGAGLGLPMVTRTVEQHSGRIDVAREVGAGAAVVVRLPVQPAQEIAA